VTKKAFLDTNIVADVMDGARVKHKDAMRLLERLILDEYDICVSEDMITTLYYICKDKTAALEFFRNVIFVDWRILSFNMDILALGVEKSLESGLDLEDILQCLCAKSGDCTLLVTNDKKFFDCGIEILSVEQFLIKN